MVETLRTKKLSATMLTHFVLINLLYPVFTSGVESAYAPNFVLANLFAVLFLAAAVLEGNLQWNRKNWLVWAIGLAMVGFNGAAFYVNWKYFGWFQGQINMTISFALFVALVLSKDTAGFNRDSFVKFLLGAVTVTNIIGFIPWLMGYTGTIFSEGIMHFYTETMETENRYSWIYLHKSEYSFMMVLFLALAVNNRHLYPKKWMFAGSIAVFVFALVIANTRTTMLAAMFILAGCLGDYVWQKMGRSLWKLLLLLAPLGAVGLGMLMIFAKDKDIWSLGHRVYIWMAAWENVLENPLGTGAMCGQQLVYKYLPKYDFGVGIANCHNVFLNLMLQFSIPAGGCCILALAAIAAASLRRDLSFRTVGIWMAIFAALMMDWCILLPQFSMMLMLFYFIFFGKQTGSKETIAFL